jgi:hypothetical protein
MVATLLETSVADDRTFPDHGRPSVGEVASVLRLAVDLRLGGMATPRSQQWGAAARYVALTGLLANAVTAAIGLVPFLAYRLVPGAFRPDPAHPQVALYAETSASFAVLDLSRAAEVLPSLLWIAAYLALVLGRQRVARWLGGAALAPSVVRLGLDLLTGHRGLDGSGVRPSDVALLLVAALPLAASVAFGPHAPPVRRRAWLRAGAAGLVLAPGLHVYSLYIWRLLRGLVEGRSLVILAVDPVTIALAALILAALLAAWRPVADRAAWQLAVSVQAGVLALLTLILAAEDLPVGGGALRYREVAVVRGLQLLLLTAAVAWPWAAARRAGPRPVAQH